MDLPGWYLLRDHLADRVVKFAQVPRQTRGDLKKFVIDRFYFYANEPLGGF